MAEGGEGESVGEKRKVKEGRESFFPFIAHVFFLPNSQTPIRSLTHFSFSLCANYLV